MPTPHPYVARNGRKTWKVRFRYQGKGCQETFDTEAEAKSFCSDIETRDVRYALRVLHDSASSSGPTVGELAEEFFAWKQGDPDVRSDRTVKDYRRDYNNWVKATFGDVPAATVDERMVQAWVDAMVRGTLGKKLEPKTVADRHMILHGIFAYATAPSRRLLAHNPAVGTRLPKRRKKAPKGLRPAEWQALYPALRQIDSAGADLALFLLSSAWRFSEAVALSAYSVEDDGQSLHVTMGQVLRRNAADQHVIVEDAKSDAGLRRVKLDPGAAAMVRERLDKVQGDGLVFTTKTGRQWHYSNFLNRIWKPAVKAANLSRNPTPHWLKHTHIGWLIMSGLTNLPEIQRRAGHDNITTTVNVYGRMVEDVNPEALDAFAAIRDGKKPPEITR